MFSSQHTASIPHPPVSFRNYPKLSGLRQHQPIISYDYELAGLSWVVFLVLPGVTHEAVDIWPLSEAGG